MSINAVWNFSKQRKAKLLPNRKRFAPWKELRFNHYCEILKKEIVVVCHRQPMSAFEYETLKYSLLKHDWKCTMVKSSIMNVALEESNLKMSITGPSLVLYGNIENFENLKLPKSIIPMSVKVDNKCLDSKAMSQVINIKHSQSNLVGVLESPILKLLQGLKSQSSSLAFVLNSVTKK
eukprot:NODE_131_length_18300_cov_0.442668.p11 type:complete len:178 gc:universal NODE_131_length_18300_cov_0.442668:6319-5786(-)